jgi:hypothetical protein
MASTLGKGVRDPAGPTRFHLGTRPAANLLDVLIISFWSSAEAAVNGDARGISPLSIALAKALQRLDAAHFEVDETILRHSNEQPIAIRIATGRFSKQGADIEMQELLRQRVPLVGDEMTEAFVGRRIVGRAVEVSFVSTWSRPPADRRLEDSFWPDIALQYDHFAVEVYAVLGIGPNIS